jgi:predicted RNase H-like nuclease
MPSVLGLDVCPGGWAGILWNGSQVRPVFGADLSRVLETVGIEPGGGGAGLPGPIEVVGIDIPIGFPDATVRRADVLARAAVGPLRSSVFSTPIRAAFEAADYPSALGHSRAALGQGLSRQAYGLQAKALQVDTWVAARSDGRPRVVEVHPEVSFAAMNGSPLDASKRTWRGVQHRRALLSEAGIDLPADLGELGRRAAVSDVLDAAAVAWTAMRVRSGAARSLPDPPEVFSDGWPAAIWV